MDSNAKGSSPKKSTNAPQHVLDLTRLDGARGAQTRPALRAGKNNESPSHEPSFANRASSCLDEPMSALDRSLARANPTGTHQNPAPTGHRLHRRHSRPRRSHVPRPAHRGYEPRTTQTERTPPRTLRPTPIVEKLRKSSAKSTGSTPTSPNTASAKKPSPTVADNPISTKPGYSDCDPKTSTPTAITNQTPPRPQTTHHRLHHHHGRSTPTRTQLQRTQPKKPIVDARPRPTTTPMARRRKNHHRPQSRIHRR